MRGEEAFWEAFPAACTAPLRGRGVLWLPIYALLSVLLALVGRLALDLAFVGSLASYFARSFGRGYDGELQAPGLELPRDFMGELVLPGLAIVGLAVLLWGPAAYLAVSTLAASAEAAVIEVAPPVSDADEEPEGDLWKPGEMFRDPNGKLVTVKKLDAPRIMQRANGRWVKLQPPRYDEDYGESIGVLVYLPRGYAAGDPDPTLIPPVRVTPHLAEEPEDDSLRALYARMKLPRGKLALALILVLSGFYYLPMALALGIARGRFRDMYNPAAVLRAAVAGGAAYAAIASLCPLLLAFVTLVAARLSAAVAGSILLGAFAYVVGVQGHLIGRLAASDPARHAAIQPA